MKLILLLLISIFGVLQAKEKQPDYYWREFNGEIPDDALKGGQDVLGNPLYIGQAFVLNHGLLVGQITPGQKTLTTSKETIHVTSVANKILCSNHPEKFYWIQGNEASLHLTTIDKHLVPGGIEWGKILNIGRIKYQGEIILGKVCSGTVGKARFYAPYKGQEVEASTYEVLAYEETSTPSSY